MTAEQMREHQLQDPACANLLGRLEGRLTVPRERPPVALSSFEMEGVLYYLRTFPDWVVATGPVPCALPTDCDPSWGAPYIPEPAGCLVLPQYAPPGEGVRG